MNVTPPPMRPEQLAAKRVWPAILSHYGDRIELANLDQMRDYVLQRIMERLAIASWGTILATIELVEGAKGENDRPATVPAAGGRYRRLSRLVTRVAAGVRRAAGAAIRVLPRLSAGRVRLPARIVWLWAKMQVLWAICWLLTAYLSLVVRVLYATRLPAHPRFIADARGLRPTGVNRSPCSRRAGFLKRSHHEN